MTDDLGLWGLGIPSGPAVGSDGVCFGGASLKTVTVRLEDEEHGKLRAVALVYDRSISEVVRTPLLPYLDKMLSDPEYAERTAKRISEMEAELERFKAGATTH